METRFSEYEPLFGSWHITEELAEGAAGRLFRIRRKDGFGVDQQAVLKVVTIPSGGEIEIKAVLASGIREDELERYYEGVVENAVNEFELMYKLKGNSHIVSYEDHEIKKRDDAFGWDILIRIEELTPLVDYAFEHPLSPADVTRMGIEICRGLVLCKKYGIIHRDIKPENIFVAPSGDFKLGDFGIATVVETTRTSLSRKGTYTYMAPEIFRGTVYGSSVDVYSLALVMYKYLNDGRNPFVPPYPDPFTHEDAESALAKRLSGASIPPPAHGSERLKEIILKGASFNKADRYQSASEMLEDLEQLLYSEKFRSGKAEAAGAGKVETYSSGSTAGVGVSTAYGETPDHESEPGTEKARGHGGTKRPRTGRRIIAAAVVIALMCGIGYYLSIPKQVTDISGIDNQVSIYIGDTLSPEYTVSPGRFAGEKISFVSVNKDVFTVSSEGTITAVAPGDAELTMTAKEYTESVSVHVIPKVTDISGIDDEITLESGASQKLAPVLAPAEFADEQVTFESDDIFVAQVEEDGTITARNPGSADVTVSAGGFVKTVKVTVKKPEPEPEPEPETYAPSGSTGSSEPSKKKTESKKSGSSSKKKSSGSGYFDSKDDEYFD